ncbi:uncharacterized protein LOC119176024 isoform X2 [Rhipicephalus microplus]|uniref:uncharacterized protein LOC119176024 isoform X2 n=1 Tax=Rhipicephalus microplus TaxID=6941 RepID=UPI003F6BA444
MRESKPSHLQPAESESAAMDRESRAPRRNSSQLREDVINAKKEICALRKCASEKLSEVQGAASSARAQCVQFAKEYDELTAKISELTTKICDEKISRLERYASATQSHGLLQYLSGVRAALRRIDGNPEEMESLEATLEQRCSMYCDRAGCEFAKQEGQAGPGTERQN